MSVLIILVVVLGVVGLFGSVIAGAYLATRLNRRELPLPTRSPPGSPSRTVGLAAASR